MIVVNNKKQRKMTANWFEAKVKYMKVNEDGREKKVNEAYLLDAMSYTEAESRIMHEMESVISGDYYISSLNRILRNWFLRKMKMTTVGIRRR